MRKLVLAVAIGAGLLGAAVVPAAEVGGVTLPETLRIGDETLRLNGAGVRSKWFFDIYVGALYLRQPTDTARQAVAMPGPKRILMHFLYQEVTREQLVKAWDEGFAANNPDRLLQSIAERIDRFNALFDTVRKGDVITMDYVPGEGTRISRNGELQGTIPGAEFSRALLRVFIGSSPPDRDLKQGMLGG